MPAVRGNNFSGSGHTTRKREAETSVAGVKTNLIALSGDSVILLKANDVREAMT